MKKQTGFTLLELMVTLVIFGTVMVIAIPKFNSLFERKSIESLVPLFERSITLARSEAIRRNTTVSIRPLETGNDWSQGWTVEYTDSDNKTITIRNFDALPGLPIFTSLIFSKARPIQIRSNGQAVVNGLLELHYPGCTGQQQIDLTLLISGNINKAKDTCP